MEEKILCPWCGAEMEEHLTYASGRGRKEYKCPKCSATSPHDETRERARAAALRRYTPPLNPMTLEEALERHVVWIEWRHLSQIWDMPIYLHRIWDEWSEAEILSYQMFGEEGENDDIANDDVNEYGKTWRCWERKPTEEERSAAGWE